MMLTLDTDMAQLVTALKWATWDQPYSIAIQRNADDTRRYALVAADELLEKLCQLPGITINVWSIADLIADLVISVAHGFSMGEPNGSQRYVLALLEAIRKHEADHANVVWTAYDN
jgi:hypothetical protein